MIARSDYCWRLLFTESFYNNSFLSDWPMNFKKNFDEAHSCWMFLGRWVRLILWSSLLMCSISITFIITFITLGWADFGCITWFDEILFSQTFAFYRAWSIWVVAWSIWAVMVFWWIMGRVNFAALLRNSVGSGCFRQLFLKSAPGYPFKDLAGKVMG